MKIKRIAYNKRMVTYSGGEVAPEYDFIAVEDPKESKNENPCVEILRGINPRDSVEVHYKDGSHKIIFNVEEIHYTKD